MKHNYRATMEERKHAYDGDTVRLKVDLGFHAEMRKMKMRLFGIDTPEIRGGTEETKAAARAARDRLRDLITGKSLTIQTFKGTDYVDKSGKYGRWLCIIWLNDENGEPVTNVNDLLVQEGHAVEETY